MALSQKSDKKTELYFSTAQLDLLAEETKQAGSFEKLMTKKRALKKQNGQTAVIRYFDDNLINYWNQFVSGTDYEKLEHETARQNRPVPHDYWKLMHKALKDRKRKREYAKEKQLEDYDDIAETVNF